MTPALAAVPYRPRTRGIPPLADVYLPSHPTGASAVLVHGGAFVIGSRRMKPMRFLAARLTAAGIAVCAIDYRMIFRGGRLPEAVDDVRAAAAWWPQRAAQLGLDARRVSLVGLSAGATLALLAADASIERLACCFGLYEPDALRGPSALLPRLLFATPDRARWRLAAAPATPTLLLHGDRDRLVPVAQAHRLAARRTALGLPTRLAILPGAPHGFFRRPTPHAEAGVEALRAHLG